jgi:putative NADPH-quinone reductase
VYLLGEEHAMQVPIILAHPAQRSYNHALAERVSRSLEQMNHTGVLHDLYREGFDPVLTEEELARKFSFDPAVQGYTEELEGAGGLVFVHPDWWGQPPAMLKGWLDRVLRTGVAYEFEGSEFGRKEQVGLLGHLRVLVIVTTDSHASGQDLQRLWEERVLPGCGITEGRVALYGPMFDAAPGQRRRWLDDAATVVRERFA